MTMGHLESKIRDYQWIKNWRKHFHNTPTEWVRYIINEDADGTLCSYKRTWLLIAITQDQEYKTLLYSLYHYVDYVKVVMDLIDTWPELHELLQLGFPYWGRDPALKMTSLICRG